MVLRRNVSSKPPLTEPRSFFADPPSWFDRTKTLVALSLGAAVAVVAAVAVLGLAFAVLYSGTLTFANPAYPGDVVCEVSDPRPYESDWGTRTATGADGPWSDGPTTGTDTSWNDEPPSSCNQPETVSRDGRPLVVEATSDGLVGALQKLFSTWVIVGVLVHGARWTADGEGDLLDAAMVAAWCGAIYAIASLGSSLVTAALTTWSSIRVAVWDATIEPIPIGPQRFQHELAAALVGLEPFPLAFVIATATCQAGVCCAALANWLDVEEGAAAFFAFLAWMLLAFTYL